MFVNSVYRYAANNPGRLAVINSGEEISYLQFAHAIAAAREFLRRASLPSGGVIVIITSNLYQDWVLLLALRSLGHTVVSGTSWQVIDGLGLQDIGGLACFAGQDDAVGAFRTGRPDCTVVEVPRALLKAGRGGAAPPLIESGEFGDQIVYTSGTTGTYKKLRFPGNDLQERLESRKPGNLLSRFEEGFFIRESVYYNHSFGPWTSAGYYMPIVAWFNGGTVIFEQRQDWIGHFFDYRVTLAFLVGPLLEQLGKSGRSRPPRHPGITVLAGGGFIDASLIARAAAIGIEVTVGYGGTEFGIGLDSYVQSVEDTIWLTPIAGKQVQIVDEADRILPTGAEGILRIESTVGDPVEYIDDPETTEKHFRDGFFYPGDMAVQRADGKIRVLGRVADVLNIGGQKIAIEPFERAARQALGVEHLCAFNQQTEDGKDLLVVVIEGSTLPDRACLEKVARNIKGIAQVRFSLIGKLPRGDNGMMKVNRRKVMELVRASLADQRQPDQEKPVPTVRAANPISR